MKRQIKKSDDRLNQVMAAASDERIRFNLAIAQGAVVKLTTFSGIYQVKYVDHDFWYHTDGNGGFGNSWCGCNDGTWAELLRQAGVERNPLFK